MTSVNMIDIAILAKRALATLALLSAATVAETICLLLTNAHSG